MRAADYIVDVGPGAGVHGGADRGAGHAGGHHEPRPTASRASISPVSGKHRRARRSAARGTGIFCSVFGCRENNLQQCGRQHPARHVDLRDGRVRLGQVLARQRDHQQKALVRAQPCARTRPGRHDALRGHRESRQGHRHRPDAPSAARRARTPRPTRACLPTSATCSPPRLTQKPAATAPAASPSTSRAAAARPAAATAL